VRRLSIALIVSTVTLTQIVSAAALPRELPVPTPPPPFSWTGLYVGINGGFGWGGRSVNFGANDTNALFSSCFAPGGSTCPPPANFDVAGGFGGFQAGYDWQFNSNAVVGIETDFDWSRIRGSGTSRFLSLPGIFPPGNASFVADQDIKSFGTLRGRLGWLPMNNLLVYGTAGFAYGRVDQNVGLNLGGNATFNSRSYFCSFDGSVVTNCFNGDTSHTATGWTAGAGIEFAAWNNFSIKMEYLYIHLGNDNVNVVAQATIGPNLIPSSFSAAYDRTIINVARVGINYKFH
jgi:outer membrane immunogenic protein